MEAICGFSLLGVSLITVFFLFLCLAGRVCYHFCWKPWSLEKQLRQQGIRGNPYRLFYGDMKEEAQGFIEAWSHPMDRTSHRIAPRVWPFACQMVQTHGKMCFLWAGPTPRVLVWDAEMVKEVMSDKSGKFMKPPTNPLVCKLATGIALLEGEEWAKRRKVITPAFHLEKLKRMVPAFQASCTDLMKRWDELVGDEGSCEVDVWPEFQNLTGDVISRTAFGSSYKEGKNIFSLQKQQIQLVMEAVRLPYIPGYRFLPTPNNKRRNQIDAEIKKLLRALIDKKLEAMRGEGSDSSDLLGLLLQFVSSANNDKHGGITIEEVIEECKLFYFAGQETTATLLTWTMIVLAMHSDWQQRACEEVLRICRKDAPDMESVNHLKIVTMILNEVMRLYPPAFQLLRHTYKKARLGEVLLPAGVNVLVPTLLINHDREVWGDDADEFNPERFAGGVSKAGRGEQNAYFPFGWGPRICVGQNFAMAEAKMALAVILQRFSFELSASYAHAPFTALTLQPQHGAHLVLHRL